MTTRTNHHQTYDRSGKLLSDVVEVVDTTNETNGATLRSRATAALTANASFIAAAKPATAAAQASAAYDQTVRLTKECSALIRLLLGLLADVSDTA